MIPTYENGESAHRPQQARPPAPDQAEVTTEKASTPQAPDGLVLVESRVWDRGVVVWKVACPHCEMDWIVTESNLLKRWGTIGMWSHRRGPH